MRISILTFDETLNDEWDGVEGSVRYEPGYRQTVLGGSAQTPGFLGIMPIVQRIAAKSQSPPLARRQRNNKNMIDRPKPGDLSNGYILFAQLFYDRQGKF